MPPILLQTKVNLLNATATTVANTMAVTGVSVGRNAVAVPLTVHGAGWQRRMATGLGLRAARMLNVRLVLLLAVRTVEKGVVKLVDVDAEGSYLD